MRGPGILFLSALAATASPGTPIGPCTAPFAAVARGRTIPVDRWYPASTIPV